MHVAIAVGTLLLGSWVLNAPTDEEEAGLPEEAQPPAVSPTAPTMPFTSPRARPTRRQPGRPAATPSGQARNQSGGTAGMPSAPTDTSDYGRDLSPIGMSGAPTVGPGAYGSPHPVAPTGQAIAARPLSRNLLDQSRGARAGLGNAASAMPDKAFAGYRSPSGVSPYMNLFRSGGEYADNYTSLVRPQVEQRFLNQQFNRDLRGLEGTSRMQNVDLQQLYRANQTLQGVGTPQYYMNYGTYYPGQQ